MSLLNNRVKFKVQSSNISSVARFISELDYSSIVLTANNCNDIYYNSSNALLYSYDTSTQNKAISLDIYEKGSVVKPIILTDEKIFLNNNINITGDFYPTSNVVRDLGSSNFLWKDVYLSGNTITLGDTKLSSDPNNGGIKIASSNYTGKFTAGRLNIITESNVINTSYMSSIINDDDGLKMLYLDDNCNIVKTIPIGIANSSILTEGSNQFYTNQRWEDWFYTRNNLDFINDGTSNRFILDDIYDGDIHSMKLLSVACNLTVYGSSTVIDTTVYQMNNMHVSNESSNISLSITQNSPYDILNIQNSNNTALYIANNTFTGVNTNSPNYNLDVSGTLNTSSNFIGDGSLLQNTNLSDKSTSHLIENIDGSNLYFTYHRVDEIVLSSNIRSSNYLNISSNIIANILTDTSNVISIRLTDTSNIISNALIDTSNNISIVLTDTSNIISNILTDTSNIISNRLTDTSNIITDRITYLDTSVIPENIVPNNLYYTSNRYDERLLSKTLDNLYKGTSNKYIINDVYNSDINLEGSLYVSNLIINGSITSLSTYTFQNESMIISTESDNDVSLSIKQTNTSNAQIMSITNYDDKGLYIFTCNFTDTSKGYIGINNSNPSYELDVNGIVKASILSGEAKQINNINLSSINTSYLKENSNNSNLYFTHERAGLIIQSSNADTSNYTLNSFNDINSHYSFNSNILYETLNNDYNSLNTRITDLTTNEITETSNLFYTSQRYDDSLLTKTLDFIHNGTSNKYIINNVYNDDLYVSSNLYASNLSIVGNSTIFNTTTYITSNLNIDTNDNENLPSLKIRQNGLYDIFEINDDTESVLKIKNGGNVGIMNIYPQYNLDITGELRSSLFIGDASQTNLVNFNDRDTGLLQENISNLWYTAERAGAILYSSNENSSNYMINSYNDIFNKTSLTSNILSQSLNNLLNVRITDTCNILIQTSNTVFNMTLETSNIITKAIDDILNIQIVNINSNLHNMAVFSENDIIFTSNLLKNYLDSVISSSINNTSQNLQNSSNYLTLTFKTTSNILTDALNNIITVQIKNCNDFVNNSSNVIYNNVINTSNADFNRIKNLSTSDIKENSNLYFNNAIFMNSLYNLRTLDNITSNNSTSNKYIINNVYNSSLQLTGSVIASNLNVVGAFTTINTNVFQTENMIINSDTEGPALKIVQNYPNCNVFEAYDDSDLVMVINDKGLTGIKTDVPKYEMDVNDTIKSTYFIGNASLSSNISLIDRNTSMLVEGSSNLYYTSLRTGIILASSNQNVSNYNLNTSNNLSKQLLLTSNTIATTLYNVSNITSYDVNIKSTTNNGSLGKFDYLYFTEKSSSNSLSIFGNSIIDYNNSNLNFVRSSTLVQGTISGTIDITNTNNLYFYYKFDSTNFINNDGISGTTFNLINTNNIQPLLTDKIKGDACVQFTNTSNILNTSTYNFGTSFTTACSISFWLKRTGLNASNDTILSGYTGSSVDNSLVISRDNATNNWNYSMFGNNSMSSNIIQVSGGGSHSLFLHSSGIVYSSGYNTQGQLGINSITQQQILKQVLGVSGTGFITGITQVSCGSIHSLFLHSSGIVYSCGYNISGALGINSTTQQQTLQQVLGVNGSGFISGIIQISCGMKYSLFLNNTGLVYSCGENDQGQLGINSIINSLVLKQVLGENGTGFITSITQVASSSGGGKHSIFLHNTGIVYSCGYNALGQLGINSTTNSTTLKQVLGINGSGFITDIIQIACGQSHSLFLHNTGIVYSCGYNGDGQLGINSIIQKQTLQQVLGLNGSGFISGIIQLNAGSSHSLFLHNTGTVYSCGLNTNGQLGLNNLTQYNSLQKVLGVNGTGFITGISSISCGDTHSLIIYNSSIVNGCGNNGNGQLGINSVVTPQKTLQQVSAPSVNALVLSNDYTADNTWNYYTWIAEKSSTQTKISIYKNTLLVYSNTSGTWTAPNTGLCLSNPVSGNRLIGNIDDLRIYNTAITSNEILDLYNINPSLTTYGNISGTINITNAVNLYFYYKFDSTNLIKNDGISGTSLNLINTSNIQPLLTDKISGDACVQFTNTSNILNTSTYNFGTSFTTACSISFWLKRTGLNTSNDTILSGYTGSSVDNSLVIRRDNATNNWNYSMFGTSDGSSLYITQIYGGSSHSLFLYNTGSVYSSGEGTYGALGLNSTTNYITLQQVLGVNGTGFITGITQISCGDKHSYFLHSSGIVYSCGYNNYGQLGINSTTQSTTLKQILGVNGSGFITGISQISCNGLNSLLLHNTGVVYACGYGPRGQLGINSITSYSTLQQVLGVNGSGFITGITQISGGFSHSLFLHNTGIVYSCGRNNFGQLGINSTTNSITLQQVLGENGIGYINNIIQLTGGLEHSLLLHNTGIVYGCGYNNFGELGLNSLTQTNVLKQVLGVNGSGFITGITQISSGSSHSLFLHNTGIVYSCGYNLYGQTGINSVVTPQTSLKQVLGVNGSGFISGITQINCGSEHSLFLHNTANVYSCGRNNKGQLGIDTLTPTSLTQVLTNSLISQVLSNDYIADNIWSHYAWVAEKSSTQTKISIYKNALLVYSNTSGTWTVPNTGLCLSNPVSGSKLIGNIDDLRIYNKAITSNEVVDLYNITKNFSLENLRSTAFNTTSNITKIGDATTSNLFAYLKTSSNNVINNLNSRGYLITSTSNDISSFNTTSSNQNTSYIRNNTTAYNSNIAITSNLIALYTKQTSNIIASNITITSNLLQTQNTLINNQFTLHNTNVSNYIINYSINTSNTLSNNITINDNNIKNQFEYSSNINKNNYLSSSNLLSCFWSNTVDLSMSNITIASNSIAYIINSDSNILSNKIRDYTLDEIYDGIHYQYITNNIFNSNLNIPHNVIAGSLSVIDIGLIMSQDDTVPNLQLKTYVNETSSNAILESDYVKNTYGNFMKNIESSWSNNSITKQQKIDTSLTSINSIIPNDLLINNTLITDSLGNITYYPIGSNYLSKNTLQFLNNKEPIQSFIDTYPIRNSNIYNNNVIPVLNDCAINLSNFLVLKANSSNSSNIISADGKVNTSLYSLNINTSNVVLIDPIVNIKFDNNFIDTDFTSITSKEYPNYSQYHTSNLLYWFKFDNSTVNYIDDTSSNLYLLQNNGIELYDDINNVFGTTSIYLSSNLYRIGNATSNVSLSGINLLDLSGSLSSSGYTFSFWVNTYNGSGTILSFANDINNPSASIYCSLFNYKLNFNIKQSNILITTYELPLNIISGKYYNIAWNIQKNNDNSLTNAVWNIFVNGVLYSTITDTYYPVSSTYTYNTIGSNMLGLLDDLRIYNEPLTSSQIYNNTGINYLIYSTQTYHNYDMLLWYNFDGILINTVNNSTYNLSLLNGSTSFNNNNVSGLSSIYLDGTTSYTADLTNIDLASVSNNGITISFTLNLNTISSSTQNVFYLNSFNTKNRIEVYIEYGVLIFKNIIYGKTQFYKLSSNVLNVNTFYTVSWVIQKGADFDKASWLIYLNGVLVFSKLLTSYFIANYNTLYIGASNSAKYFKGFLDDFRIYNKCLSAYQVKLISYTPTYPLLSSDYYVNSFKLDKFYQDNVLLNINFKDTYTINNKFMVFNINYHNPIYDNGSYYVSFPYNKYFHYNIASDVAILVDTIKSSGFNLHFAFNSLYTLNTPIIYIGDNTTSVLNVNIVNNNLLFDFENGTKSFILYNISPDTWYNIDFCCRFTDYNLAVIEIFINGILYKRTNYNNEIFVYSTTLNMYLGHYNPIFGTQTDTRITLNTLKLKDVRINSSYTTDITSVNSNLQFHYKFNNDAFTNNYGISGSSYQLINTSNNLPLLTDSVYGSGCAQFNDASNILYTSPYNFSNFDESCSISFWFKNSGLNIYNDTILSGYSNGVVDNSLIIRRDNNTNNWDYKLFGIEGNSNLLKTDEIDYGITQISGGLHSLFLHNTGIVYSCGYNIYGQLGINSTTNSLILQQVFGVNGTGFITGIIQVVCGSIHSLFLHNTGIVYSCGHNVQGQLGINSLTNSTTLKQVLGVNGSGFISGITQISGGEGQISLFLHSSGIVYSCGYNGYGQLGINSLIQQQTLQQVLGVNGSGFITDIIQISSGGQFSLFLHSSGIVYSCGLNIFGALGINSKTQQQTLQQVLGVNGTGFITGITKISCGSQFSLFLHSSGIVYSCGQNDFGQLGINSITHQQTLQQVLGENGSGFITGITHFSGGQYHSLFLDNTGIVYSCGFNANGQLGINSTTRQQTLQKVFGVNGSGFISGITRIVCCNSNSFFIHNTGVVYSCGYNGYGQLGINSLIQQQTLQPILKKLLNNNIQILPNDYIPNNIWNHYTFITEKVGTQAKISIYKNASLQYSLISGTWTPPNTGLCLSSPNTSNKFIGNIDELRIYNTAINYKQISDLYNNTQKIYTDYNLHFHYKFDIDSTSLTSNDGLSGTSYSLINTNNIQPLLSDNVIGTSCANFNDTSNILYTPSYNFTSNFTDSCSISFWLKKTGLNTENDTILCGYNNGVVDNNIVIRRLNKSNTWDYSLFGALPPYSFTQVSGGGNQSLFLTNTGTVYSCGYNTKGQLGINSLTNSATLSQVLGVNGSGFITGITQVSGGDLHSLFLHSSGNVYSCGYNGNGQLGINSLTDSIILNNVNGVNGIGFITGISQISCGQNHSLFLDNTGIVYSCGYAFNGQLGINNTTNQQTIQKVLGVNGIGFITGISQISCGQNHSLFLHNTGIVYSCGNNQQGALGINNTTNSTTLQQVLGINGSEFITGITQISGGGNHSLFLHNTGIVYSCGQNSQGQLGINSLTQSTTLKQVLGVNGTGFITGIAQLIGCNSYSLFLHSSGIVYSCGYNSAGQLGINSLTDSMTLKQVLGVNGSGFISGISQISAGAGHALFLHSSGVVYSCGNNVFGSLGINSFVTPQLTLQQVQLYKTLVIPYDYTPNNIWNHYAFITEKVGTQAKVSIYKNASLQYSVTSGTWISSNIGLCISSPNTSNKLIGNIDDLRVYNTVINPKQIYDLYNYSQKKYDDSNLQFHYKFNIADFTSNYGASGSSYPLINSSNILPSTDYVRGTSSVSFNRSSNILNTQAYNFNGDFTNACSISLWLKKTGLNTSNDTVLSGYNDGTTDSSFVIRRDNTTSNWNINMFGSQPSYGITKIASGYSHSLFLHNTGIVYGCGNNGYGQLGINSTTNSITLQQVLGINGTGFITGITQISCGMYHSLFLHSSGIVYSCGFNGYGQLGINSIIDSSTLQQVRGINGGGYITGITQISCGYYHSLFLNSSINVYSCGQNPKGQLGINSTTQQQTLQQVLGVNGSGVISGITQISGGGSHSLFLHNTGIVYSCGYNGGYQLGINSATDSLVLKQVLGVNGTGFITGIIQVSSGIIHSLFLHNSGIVYSCGQNDTGQLGINSTSTATTLQQVLGVNGIGFITGITRVSCSYYSLFLHNTGIVYSCGMNQYGGLGINSTTQSTTLKQVLDVNSSGFISGISQISCGGYHSLFLNNIGFIYSCGRNLEGQLGINSTTDSTTLQLITVVPSSANMPILTNDYITDNTWNNYVYIAEKVGTNTKLSIYKNTLNVYSLTFGTWTPPIVGLCISHPDINSKLIGNIDDLRIYNKVLTTKEMSNIYNGIETVSTSNTPYTSNIIDEIDNTINSNIITVYNAVFDNNTIYGGTSLKLNTSNILQDTFNTYASISSSLCDFGSSNNSISLWFDISDKYLNYQSITSNYSLNDARISTSLTQNVVSNSIVYSSSSFTNVYISGYNNNYHLSTGNTINSTGFTGSWSTNASVNGLIEARIYKIFTSLDSSTTVYIYLMDNGMIYSTGRNTLGLFGLPTQITVPSLIKPFWDSGDSIADIKISDQNIYFITKSGKLYGLGNNLYNNIYDTGATAGNALNANTVIYPMYIDKQWWGGDDMLSFTTISNCLIISTKMTVYAKGLYNGVTYSTWTSITTIANIIEIYAPITNRIYYRDSLNNYYFNGTLIQLVSTSPVNQSIISISCNSINALILTDSGNVYTSTTNIFTTSIYPSWGNDTVIKISTGYYNGSPTNVFLTKSGKVYGNGYSNWGELNVVSTTITNPVLLPITSQNYNAIVKDIYMTNYFNVIAITQPPNKYNEFGGNSGEYIKYDNGIKITAKGSSINIKTPFQYTVNTYNVNIKVFGTNDTNALSNDAFYWNKLGENNTIVSYSTSNQVINTYFENTQSYRYYAILVYCNYNLDISNIVFYTQNGKNMTLLNTCIDTNNSLTIGIENTSNIKYTIKNNNNNTSLSADISASLYSFNHITITNNVLNNITNMYLNGINISSSSNINIPIGDYKYTNVGRMYYNDNIPEKYNYFMGSLSDLRIINNVLSDSEILTLYRGTKINNTVDNKNYSLITNDTTYMVNKNNTFNKYLLNILNTFGAIIRFSFKTSNVKYSPLLLIGALNDKKLSITVMDGCLYILLGNYVLTTRRIITNDIWYNLSIFTKIATTQHTLSLYIGDIPQLISVNKSVYSLYQVLTYDNSIVPINNAISYIGAYNPSFNYKDIVKYRNDMIFKNTYHGSLSPFYNSSNFDGNSTLYTYSSNLTSILGGANNYIDNLLVSSSNIQNVITELRGNIYLDEGYYNFSFDVQSNIACDLSIGFNDIVMKVSEYYSSNVINVNACKTTDKPIYLNGYYNIKSRVLQKYTGANNYLNIKYIKQTTYTDDYYTIVSPTINYSLTSNVVDVGTLVDINMGTVYINSINNINDIRGDFYINMTNTEKLTVYIQDFRVYENADIIGNNFIRVFDNIGSMRTITYNTYNELTDVNRWCKTNNYYMYQNGDLTRGVFYNEGFVGIGTSAPKASLDIYTTTAGIYSIKTNNTIWVGNSVIASSDSRIKNNIVDIDDDSALNTLLRIEPKTYGYIDKSIKTDKVYGFIAQQIAEVFPGGAKKAIEFIPNIYASCYAVDDMLVFEDDSIDIYSKVVKGDKIRIIYDDKKIIEVFIKEIVNNSTIIIDKNIGVVKVLVYGKEVNDFNIIDKSAIYTLNVCATQDLYRCVVEQTRDIDENDKLISQLESLIENI